MTDETTETTTKPNEPLPSPSKDRPSFWANALSGVALDDKRSWFNTTKKSEVLTESTTNSVEESVPAVGRDSDTSGLALRIKTFLEDSKNLFKPQNKLVQEPQFDSEGLPIPPPAPSNTDKDSDLYSILSSASILSGPSKGKGRQRTDDEFKPAALWSVLDRSRADDRSDTSSLMMYSPLIPTLDSLVEVAETKAIEPVVVSEPAAPLAPPTWTEWAFGSRKAKSSVVEATQPQRVWIPSTSKLSVQVMWWGYRIYLPPSVLEILNNKQLEATKRAAIITGALQWLIGNIPLAAIPPPLQPIVFLLQQLVPLVSYVGAFIAWSWSAVKSFDSGYGVTLTATWILPVALVPATWDVACTDVTGPEAPSHNPLLTTPARLSFSEAERAFSLPPSSSSKSTENASSSSSNIPASPPSIPLENSSPLHIPPAPLSAIPAKKLSSHIKPTTFTPPSSSSTMSPLWTPVAMSPSPLPLKNTSTHRRPHVMHHSATVPTGNALGLYTPASPTKSLSVRSSSTRVKSPLSTSSTTLNDGRSKKIKHSCCANCTAAALAAKSAGTPRRI